MNTAQAKLKRAAILLTGIFAASIPVMANADWSIIDLGTLGSRESYASGINDSGQVVGHSYNSGGPFSAFITGPNGVGMTNLLPVGLSFAYDINDSGQVVGYSFIGDNEPFITGPNGVGITDLVGSYSIYKINDSGQVVGQNGSVAFITGPNGVGMTDLGTLGGNGSFINGLNNSGQVVGYSYIAGGKIPHAFITGPNGVGMADLGTLGGHESYANGINDSGQVVGYSSLATGGYHAFITGPNSTGMTDLGTLGGFYSTAIAINDSGEVVGSAGVTPHGRDYHAFLFSHGGMTDLDLLPSVVAAGWNDLSVTDINNHGQIVGYGHHDGYYGYKAFLLSYTPDTVFTPNPIFIPSVPEPETYAMLLAGLGLIGCMAWRRKKAGA